MKNTEWKNDDESEAVEVEELVENDFVEVFDEDEENDEPAAAHTETSTGIYFFRSRKVINYCEE